MGKSLQTPKEGDLLRAVVQQITRRNVVLRLGNGLRCLMDPSYLIWLKRPTVNIKLKKGTEIDVEVKTISDRARLAQPYIYVGHLHTDERPWYKAQGRHAVGRRERCTVIEFVPGNAIVEFKSKFWGWLPDAEVTWGKPTKAFDTFRRREEIEVVVQSHDQAKRRILVSTRMTRPESTGSDAHPIAASVTPDQRKLHTPPLILTEGMSYAVELTVYERNPEARSRCLAHHGSRCCVCGFDFGAAYGPLAAGLIHVHHLVPLAQIGEEHPVDPVRNLRPVCPNCHAVIHLGGGTLTIEQVKQMLVDAERSQSEAGSFNPP